MPIHKIITNAPPTTQLFQKLSKYNKLETPTAENGIVILTNKENEKVTIDFADIFIFNSLILDFDNSTNLHNIERVSYSMEQAYKIHSFLVFISSNFPQLIYSNIWNMSNAFQMFLMKMILNREHDILNNSHLFFIEESDDGSYINLTCNNNMFLKMDLFEERIFFIYNGKMGMFCLPFIENSERIKLTEQLNNLFETFDLSTRIELLTTGDLNVEH